MNKYGYIFFLFFLLLCTGCEKNINISCEKTEEGVISSITGTFIDDKLYSINGYIKQDVNDDDYNSFNKLYSILNDSYTSYGFDTNIESNKNYIKLEYNVSREKIVFLDKDVSYTVDMSVDDFKNINVIDGYVCK